MKAFVAYRHTGENLEDLHVLLTSVRDSLRKIGVEPYCTFFDEEAFQSKSLSPKQIMDHAFDKIDHSDMLFVIQKTDDKSEGMLMEVGYCLAKKIPVVVATKNTIGSTYLPSMGSYEFKWSSPQDLAKKISLINLHSLVS